MLLEVIVQTLADARAAHAGGADRLEVVRALEREGLTPPVDLVRAIQAETGLPLRVMVRESDGFVIHGATEIASLQRAAASFAELHVDGIVLGFADGRDLEIATMRTVLEAAPDIKVTCHRAFDATSNPLTAIDALHELPQVDRVLTSGGEAEWPERCRRLEQYVARAAPGIAILVGGGIDTNVARLLTTARCVEEIHVGRAAREHSDQGAPVSSARVRELKSILGGERTTRS